MEESNFRNWYIETSALAGGLVTQKVASLISGISESQISRKAKSGKIKVYNHPLLTKGLISYKDALELKRERAPKK
ncbi:MAG: hypothetical protein HPZ91_00605 [Lentisphaeria bacterium]|nr:hypothetical protein [Lentisphaeria bacterium]MBS1368430.1 hypothetical protein [Lentisphaeria bacterium]